MTAISGTADAFRFPSVNPGDRILVSARPDKESLARTLDAAAHAMASKVSGSYALLQPFVGSARRTVCFGGSDGALLKTLGGHLGNIRKAARDGLKDGLLADERAAHAASAENRAPGANPYAAFSVQNRVQAHIAFASALAILAPIEAAEFTRNIKGHLAYVRRTVAALSTTMLTPLRTSLEAVAARAMKIAPLFRSSARTIQFGVVSAGGKLVDLSPHLVTARNWLVIGGAAALAVGTFGGIIGGVLDPASSAHALPDPAAHVNFGLAGAHGVVGSVSTKISATADALAAHARTMTDAVATKAGSGHAATHVLADAHRSVTHGHHLSHVHHHPQAIAHGGPANPGVEFESLPTGSTKAQAEFAKLPVFDRWNDIMLRLYRVRDADLLSHGQAVAAAVHGHVVPGAHISAIDAVVAQHQKLGASLPEGVSVSTTITGTNGNQAHLDSVAGRAVITGPHGSILQALDGGAAPGTGVGSETVADDHNGIPDTPPSRI